METVYLDMCSLKRPHDDQTQGRIWAESQAVIRILSASWVGFVRICSSWALLYENEADPDPIRRERVSRVLEALDRPPAPSEHVRRRAEMLIRSGVREMDALHLACAEDIHADHFVTCDDDLLSKARRLRSGTRVWDPVSFVREMNL
jgi:predicted nucleic acid-binding protein